MVMFLPTKYSGVLNETNKNQRLLQCVTVASSKCLPQTPSYLINSNWESLIFI
jgi:hypothetical protein